MKIKTKGNITKKLEKAFGGKWKYNGLTSWLCDDGIRSVSRCCACFDDNETSWPSQYWLYGDGSPRMVNDIVWS